MNNNVQNSTEGYNKINNWPLNFLRTGYYNRSYGNIHIRTSDGLWWSVANYSNINARRLNTYPSGIVPNGNGSRGTGFAVRCVVRERWNASWISEN